MRCPFAQRQLLFKMPVVQKAQYGFKEGCDRTECALRSTIGAAPSDQCSNMRPNFVTRFDS